MDAAIDAAPLCSVQCDNSQFCGAAMNTPAFPALRIGTEAMRAPGDWFITFGADAGPLANRKAFDIFVTPSPTGAVNPDVLAIRVLKPAAGNFPLNQATAVDPDPNSATPAAWSFWLGDITTSGNMITDVAQTYWANMGSVTLMNISENDGGQITGTTAPLNWREINDMGMDVAGGCTASMGAGGTSGFGFFLTQMATAFQDDQTQTFGGWRVITGAEREMYRSYINKKFAPLWQN